MTTPDTKYLKLLISGSKVRALVRPPSINQRLTPRSERNVRRICGPLKPPHAARATSICSGAMRSARARGGALSIREQVCSHERRHGGSAPPSVRRVKATAAPGSMWPIRSRANTRRRRDRRDHHRGRMPGSRRPFGEWLTNPV
jgi:hypothetical protein